MGKWKDWLSTKFLSCLNLDCNNLSWEWNKKFCTDCGHELTPLPKCECGETIALKRLTWVIRKGQTQFCAGCGKHITEKYLAEHLSKAFKVMVSAVSKDLSAAHGQPALPSDKR